MANKTTEEDPVEVIGGSQYIVLDADSLVELCKTASEMVADGWILAGGIEERIVDDGEDGIRSWYHQALYRPPSWQ